MLFEEAYPNLDYEDFIESISIEEFPDLEVVRDNQRSIFIWKDLDGNEAGRLMTIFKETDWEHNILSVSSPRVGFLKELAYVFGKYAYENGIEKFIVPGALPESKGAFLSIGFKETDDPNSLTANTKDIYDYGAWSKGEADEPEWHKELNN